jgi:cell division protein FtsB
MTARLLSEHRRLLATTSVLVLLVVVALAALRGGSSAAQRSRQPPAVAALVASRGRLVAEQAQVKQLQTLSSRQSVEISSLKAQLQALRHPQSHSHRHRRR